MEKHRIAFIDSLDNEIADVIYKHLCGVINSNTELLHIKANGGLPAPESTKSWLAEDRINGLIFSGSTYSVNDDVDWIKNQCAVTAEILSDDTIDLPCLGLCFGHQMFAKAAGVEIERVEETISGLKNYSVVAKDDLLQDLPKQFTAFVYHNDIVTTIPENFELLIDHIDGITQGIKHKSRPIYGLQSHPEGPYSVMRMFNDEITEEQYPTEFGNQIIRNFSKIVADHRTS